MSFPSFDLALIKIVKSYSRWPSKHHNSCIRNFILRSESKSVCVYYFFFVRLLKKLKLSYHGWILVFECQCARNLHYLVFVLVSHVDISKGRGRFSVEISGDSMDQKLKISFISIYTIKVESKHLVI